MSRPSPRPLFCAARPVASPQDAEVHRTHRVPVLDGVAEEDPTSLLVPDRCPAHPPSPRTGCRPRRAAVGENCSLKARGLRSRCASSAGPFILPAEGHATPVATAAPGSTTEEVCWCSGVAGAAASPAVGVVMHLEEAFQPRPRSRSLLKPSTDWRRPLVSIDVLCRPGPVRSGTAGPRR